MFADVANPAAQYKTLPPSSVCTLCMLPSPLLLVPVEMVPARGAPFSPSPYPDDNPSLALLGASTHHLLSLQVVLQVLDHLGELLVSPNLQDGPQI